MRHKGKTALVTGAARGIGEGIARRLASEGCTVYVADIAEAAAKQVADVIGGQAIGLDVTDEAAMDAAFASIEKQVGVLDIVVNNAGVMDIGPVVDKSYAAWQRLMRINLDGVFLGSRAAAQLMKKQGRGVIVNASSGAGRRGVGNLSSYCASKAAIIMFSQSLAIEMAPFGVTVNCYAPGHIETPFWDEIAARFGELMGKTNEEVIEVFRDTVPMGRFGTPDDVAAAVSWLATDDAAYISGQSIAMNGAEFPF